MNKPVKCSEVIRSCEYSMNLSNAGGSGMLFCDYLCKTKERRGCDPEQCTRYKRRKGAHARTGSNYSVVLDKPSKSKTILEIEAYELRNRKRETVKTAKDFGYGEEVIRRLDKAESVGEVDRIMREARRAKFK